MVAQLAHFKSVEIPRVVYSIFEIILGFLASISSPRASWLPPSAPSWPQFLGKSSKKKTFSQWVVLSKKVVKRCYKVVKRCWVSGMLVSAGGLGGLCFARHQSEEHFENLSQILD